MAKAMQLSKVDSQPQQQFTIRDLCDAFSVTPRALRFYEEKGLCRHLDATACWKSAARPS